MYIKGLKDGIAIALGYLSVSFTFGLMSVESGLKVYQAVAISMLCLTSAGQFAGLDIMLHAGGYFEMILSQFIINLRYSLMSISISQKADETMTTPVRWVVGFGVTDEVFGVSMAGNKSLSKSYMLGLITLPYFGWAFGTLLGALVGNIIPDRVSAALGIAIYAMFLAIIIPPAKKDRGILFVISLCISMSCLMYYTPLSRFISSGFRIILIGIVGSLAGAILFPIRENDERMGDPL